MLQVTTDGTQLDSQQTPRPSPATVRLRSSMLAGPCLEPSVRSQHSVPSFPKLACTFYHWLLSYAFRKHMRHEDYLDEQALAKV